MFVSCVVSKRQKCKMQDNQDVQSTREYKKNIPVLARFSSSVQTGPGAHSVSYIMGIVSVVCLFLSRG
jgi:hypothetical protein